MTEIKKTINILFCANGTIEVYIDGTSESEKEGWKVNDTPANFDQNFILQGHSLHPCQSPFSTFITLLRYCICVTIRLFNSLKFWSKLAGAIITVIVAIFLLPTIVSLSQNTLTETRP